MTTADATHESRRAGGRYSSVSIGLHWLIAALLISQVVLGMRFGDMPRGPGKGEAFALHMSLGITILLLSLARLGWRISHPAPPLPTHYKASERLLARATHVLFYVVMIGMPLSGWVMTSAGPRPLPELWGAIPWPKLPVDGASAERASKFHDLGPWIFWTLLALHVAGALKHQLLDRDGTLWRMLPIVGRGSRN
jgi:cytochrome b561